jgi:hypothetical protein
MTGGTCNGAGCDDAIVVHVGRSGQYRASRHPRTAAIIASTPMRRLKVNPQRFVSWLGKYPTPNYPSKGTRVFRPAKCASGKMIVGTDGVARYNAPVCRATH